MRYLIILICVAFIGGANSAPNPPSLTPAKSDEKEQFKTEKREQDTTADQRGTEKAPLAVKLLNTGKTEAEAAQEAIQIKQRENADRRIFWLTFVLVSATILQFIALVVQAHWLRRTVKATEEIGRASVAVELPIVFVTNIGFNPQSWSSRDSKERLPACQCKIEVNFKNFGRTPAITTEICVQWKLCSELPPEPQYEVVRALTTGSIVNPLERSQFETEYIDMSFPQSQLADVHSGTSGFWVYGFIGFRDFMGASHRTGFCARWAKGSDKTGRPYEFVEDGQAKYKYQT